MSESLDDDPIPCPHEEEVREPAESARPAPIDPPSSRPIKPGPHSLEAERQVLGAMLLDGNETIVLARSKGLQAAAFFSPANGLVYDTILSLADRGQVPDAAIVMQDLKDRGQLEAIGGFGYLVTVTGAVATTAQAEYFIGKVGDLWRLRELIHAVRYAEERAHDPSIDVQEFSEALRARVEQLTENRGADDILTARAYNPLQRLPKPAGIFTLADTTICTAGNLCSIYSQAKTGKSSFIGAMMSAAMTVPTGGRDCLAVVGPNYAKHALIHFDTEQSLYDRQQLIETSCRRAGVAKLPPWVMSYCLTGLSALECRQLLERALKLGRKRHGGVFAVIIDGIGDLVTDPNNQEECFPLITRLHYLAIEYQTSIISVLHMNPGAEEKGRGHLGSQLERKSESNLTMEKTGDVTRVWATKQRGKMILKDEGPTFRWSVEMNMHVSCAKTPAGPTPGGRPLKFSFASFREIFPARGAPGLGMSLLHRRVATDTGISLTAFREIVVEAVNDGMLMKIQDPVRGPIYTLCV